MLILDIHISGLKKIIIKESIELVKRFNAKGFLVFIITNQSGIGRGYYTINDFYEFMKKLINYFEINDAIIHDYFFVNVSLK